MTKYPQVKCKLSGTDGNVFAIISKVRRSMREAGAAPSEIEAFEKEAFDSESYDHVLRLAMKTVDVS